MTRSRTRELELKALIDSHKPNVVVLSEVELNAEDSSFYIPGYTVFYPSPFKNKHRVLLLLQDLLVRRCNPSLLASSHQEIWIRLAGPSGSWIVGACYRQWNGTESADLVSLLDNVSAFSSSSSRVLLAGDFNLDAARKDDPQYYRRAMLNTFLSRLDELGYVLENDVSIPTYQSHGSFQMAGGTGHRESVLDLLFSLGTSRPRVRILDNAASDHRPVLAVYSMGGERAPLKTHYCRDIRRATPGALLMAVNAARISDVFAELDVDKITDTLTRELRAALDLVAPLRQVQIKDRMAPLFLSRETRRTMAARDAAAGRRDWPLYRSLRNLASRQVRKDRLATNAGVLLTCSHDPRRLWQLADSLTGRGKAGGLPPRLVHEGRVVEGDDELADIMNHHYITKIAGIRERIELGRVQQRLLRHQPGQELGRARHQSASSLPSSSSSFALRPPTVTEVLKAITGLKNTPATGEDGVPTKVVKDLAQVLAAPLAHLAKRSFISGRVPALFKYANVVPVYKRVKDSTQPSSYRPVAILCALSKVLESLVLSQLTPFLSQRLPTAQWGFRRARSTAGALAAAHGGWTRSRVKGETVAVAAFDFSSAFDTLGVEELVLKLQGLDIGGPAVSWFQDYLSGRHQRVRYGSSLSTLRDVSYGVPQGSLLGPVLFTALTSDLPDALGNNVSVTLYADDTCIWCADKDPGVVKKELESASSRLLSYALDNSLALNPDKTQLIWSSNPSPIRVGSTVVHPQEELLLLGVKFDRRFTVTPHLRALASTARSLLALTRRLLLHLPRGRQVQDVVNSLVMGRLCYGSILFPPRLTMMDPSSQLVQDIQVPVNDMARLLLGASRADRIPVEQLLGASGLPGLNRVVIRTIICETWKCLHSCDGPGGGLNPLGVLLSPPAPPVPAAAAAARETRSTCSGALPPPMRVRAETFTWWAMKIYNEIPQLRTAQSLAAAKRIAQSYSSAAPLS